MKKLRIWFTVLGLSACGVQAATIGGVNVLVPFVASGNNITLNGNLTANNLTSTNITVDTANIGLAVLTNLYQWILTTGSSNTALYAGGITNSGNGSYGLFGTNGYYYQSNLTTFSTILLTNGGAYISSNVVIGGTAPLKLSNIAGGGSGKFAAIAADGTVTAATPAGVAAAYLSKSADYQVLVGDGSPLTIAVDASGGARTITLCASASANNQIVHIVHSDSSTNVVYIVGSGVETLNGFTNDVVQQQYQRVTWQANGTGYTRLSPPPSVTVKTPFLETKTSSASAADATNLCVQILPNRYYHFRYVTGITNVSTVAGIRVAINGPASPTSFWMGAIVSNNGANLLTQQTVSIGSAQTLATTSGLRELVVEGAIDNGSTAGGLRVQWAQNTSDSNATSLVPGGSFTVWQDP